VSGRIAGSIKLAALVVFAFFAVSSAEAAPPTATIVVSPNQLGRWSNGGCDNHVL
jgi:hypothetical protein